MLRALVTYGILFCSSSAWASDGALARIVAVEKTQGTTTEVTLNVESGAFYNDTEVELLAPNFKLLARLKLPSGIDMLMKGDEVKRVTLVLREAKPVAGFIAEPGKFANHEAAQKALTEKTTPIVGKPASKSAAQPALAQTTACPYSSQELSAALGLKLDEGKGNATPFSGGVSYSCSFGGINDFSTVYINQIVMPHEVLVASEKEFGKRLAGNLTYIPSDPDFARWQTDQGDLTGVVLHYLRNGVQVEIRVMPGASFMKDRAKVEAMKARVLKFRRLP